MSKTLDNLVLAAAEAVVEDLEVRGDACRSLDLLRLAVKARREDALEESAKIDGPRPPREYVVEDLLRREGLGGPSPNVKRK